MGKKRKDALLDELLEEFKQAESRLQKVVVDEDLDLLANTCEVERDAAKRLRQRAKAQRWHAALRHVSDAKSRCLQAIAHLEAARQHVQAAEGDAR